MLNVFVFGVITYAAVLSCVLQGEISEENYGLFILFYVVQCCDEQEPLFSLKYIKDVVQENAGVAEKIIVFNDLKT